MTKITQKNYEAIAIYRQKEKLFELKGKIQTLETENTQLKELLKECRSPINYALCLNLSEEEKTELKNLLAKIKQVLGEE